MDRAGVRSFLFRWRRWLVVLAVLLAIRAALPPILRRVVESQASQQLQTRVTVGDVDLALYRGGVALKDVAVYSPTAVNEPPLVAWTRFAVEVRFIPLLWKTVQLRRVLLEAPRIALDRLANGELNLQRLVPPPAAEAPPAEQATKPAKPWKTGIDRFVLRAGAIRFRDLTLAEGEPLEIAIPDIDVAGVALQPGVYGEPGRLRLYVKTEGGAVRVDSRLTVLDAGFGLDTRLKAYRLPLRRARLYVPGVGWSELAGELDTVLDHALAPGGRNEVRGMVRLRNVAVRVPDVPQSALAVERFAVRVAPIDLASHRATVSAVDVAGASVLVDLQGGDVLPLLRRARGEQAAAPAPSTEPAPPAPAAPWHWSVGRLSLRDSKVALAQEGAPLDVGVTVAARNLSDGADPGRIEVKLDVPPGSVSVAGAVTTAPPRFGGTVRIAQLPVHDLARAARAAAGLPPGLLRAATLDTDLTLEAGLTAEGAAAARPDAVRAKGTVTLDGVDVAGPDPGLFAVAWKRFAVPVDELELPGLLPGAPTGAPGPMHAVLGAVRLEEPSVQTARTAEGIVLPPPLARSPDASAPPPAPAPPADAAPVRAVDVAIASFVLAHGRIGFTDQTVKPFFAGEVKPLDVDARGIRSQGPVVEHFTLSARTPQKGRIDVMGALRPEGGTIRVNGKDVALAPYNPFVTTYSSYSLGQGSTLTVDTNVKLDGPRYDTTTAITLHRLTVRGAQGDKLFKEHFGIPLSMALALLRDLEGNIRLNVPVVVDQSGTSVALGPVVGGAIRDAILGAVTSPLKGIGAIIGSGEAGTMEPAAVAVEVGRATPTSDGEKTVGQLAELLAGRPGLGVELDPFVTPADARWLQEQDLHAELEARTGVVNALRDLPERRMRGRIVKALAERAAGKKGELDRDDQAKLDAWLAERPAVPPERLQALARDRGTAVATMLRERHGIPGDRVKVGEPPEKPPDGPPAVLIELGAAGE